mgnify:CR=1 FL=1
MLLLAFQQSIAQMEFVENKGQWDQQVKYKGDFTSGSFFLRQKGFSVLLHNAEEWDKITSAMHGRNISKASLDEKIILHSFFYDVDFEGASDLSQCLPDKQIKTYNNYFIGNDASKWKSECKIFQAVQFKNIYPNIDIRYYTDGDRLKYDFIIYPGADPSQIVMNYRGPEKVYRENDQLVIKTTAGDVKELYPYSYQPDPSGNRIQIGCHYQVENNKVSFDLGNYDKTKMMIIDPAIIFSSFTGSAVDNWGYTATPGPDGSFYAGGIAFGNGYLTSPGAYQTTYNGGVFEGVLKGHDIAIFKFNSNGTDRLYATYLGGNGNEQPHSMIVDAQGNLIVAGRSFSVNYPTTIPVIGPGGNNDIVITKFNATGTALIGSVKIGGSGNDGVNIRSKYESPDGADRTRRNYGDDARSEVILDNSNNIILASCTQSNNFPVTGNSLNTAGFGGGQQDGVILKFNPNLSTYLFGSYFGGSGDDACFVATFNPVNNDLYVAGGTTSNNLPGNKIGAIYPNYQGGTTDGFVVKLRLDGTGINKTTYLGTTGIDMVYGLKFDRAGYPYVMGTTTGVWPVLNATYSNPNSAQFISKLKPDLSGFSYSTVFGTGSLSPNISPIGFMVDRCENVYVSGWGGGINVFKGYSNGNTNGLPLVNSLSGANPPDGEDFYFFVLKKNASDILFASNFGQYRGTTGDHVDGGTSRFDENGTIYQAMCANCNGGATFPTTTGAWRRLNGSSNCNEAAVKIEMNFSGVAAGPRSSINAILNDTAGCVPFRVDFSDTLQKAKKYYWDFGNGLRDTTLAPDYSTFTTYNTVGVYTVRVIAEDSLTCNIRDTFYLKIKAGDNLTTLDFTAVKDLPCTSLSYSFNNLSTPTRGSFSSQSFSWDYGDGSPRQTSFNGSHNYPAVGTYTVTLYLNDDNFCNSPDSKKLILKVNPLVEAKLSTSPVGCVPYNALFTNLSGTSDVTWEFSDGTTTNVENPVKLFSTPGTYQVRIIARDPNTCNLIDTSDYFSFIVSERPNAAFTWQPNPPITNTPTQFTNLSTGATHYLWNFGDGQSSTAENPPYQYISTDNFNAQLIAYNQYECTDTFTLVVRTLIDPLLDVPNAFTPGRFGENGVIKVKGFGISKLDWKIYNRWGQLVFQSNSIYKGWDGTFKGKLQPMDVYTYTLEANLTNGQLVKKTGDITLIR